MRKIGIGSHLDDLSGSLYFTISVFSNLPPFYSKAKFKMLTTRDSKNPGTRYRGQLNNYTTRGLLVRSQFPDLCSCGPDL